MRDRGSMPPGPPRTTVGDMTTALITGASRGLGLALTTHLSTLGWRVVVDARGAESLREATRELPGVLAVAGDLTDEAHRADLVAAVGDRLDLLVLNASTLGQHPLPALADYDVDRFRDALETNTVAPLRLLQLALPALRAAEGTVIAVSSDAAVEGYPGWGGYGASKAALDQLTRVLGAEEPTLSVYAVDPGDMRTRMHADAFPGEDISDRPSPESVVPTLESVLRGDLESGRYRAAALPALAAAGGVE